MVRHIVWWTIKENANGRTAEENAWHIQQASSMLKGISSVLSVEVSCNIQPGTTVPAQLVLSSTHADMDALQQYQVDPAHVQFAALIKPIATSRNALDYIID